MFYSLGKGSSMQVLRREKLTMLALALAGGRPLSRVQLQKAVFLFQEQLPPSVLPPHPQQLYHFEKHNFGAFCSEIYVDAYKLSTQGLATAEPDSKVGFKSIAATEHIARHMNGVLRDMPFEVYEQANKIVEWVLEEDFEGLVSEVYSQYPEYKERSIFRRLRAGLEAGINVFTAARYPEIVPELIDIGYQVRDRLNVQRFLREHSFLVPMLVETIPNIREYFPNAQIRLELFQDPEAEAVFEHLFIKVATDLQLKEARDAFKKLQTEWWLSKLPKARGHLTIGLAYV